MKIRNHPAGRNSKAGRKRDLFVCLALVFAFRAPLNRSHAGDADNEHHRLAFSRDMFTANESAPVPDRTTAAGVQNQHPITP